MTVVCMSFHSPAMTQWHQYQHEWRWSLSRYAPNMKQKMNNNNCLAALCWGTWDKWTRSQMTSLFRSRARWYLLFWWQGEGTGFERFITRRYLSRWAICTYIILCCTILGTCIVLWNTLFGGRLNYYFHGKGFQYNNACCSVAIVFQTDVHYYMTTEVFKANWLIADHMTWNNNIFQSRKT